MHPISSCEEEGEVQGKYDRSSTPRVFGNIEVNVGKSGLFRKYTHAPWDASVLKGIEITSSLSALRAQAKAEMAKKMSEG